MPSAIDDIAILLIFGNERSEISFWHLPIKINLNDISVMTLTPDLQTSIGEAYIHTHEITKRGGITAAL